MEEFGGSRKVASPLVIKTSGREIMKSLIEIFLGPPGLIMLAAFLGAIGALWSASQQANFERVLREKSDEIAELNQTTLNAVTGGDSYCYLQLYFNGPAVKFVFNQAGDHTIFDVTARIVNLDEFDIEKGNFTLESLAKTDTIIELGTMIAGFATMEGQIPLGKIPQRGFNIFFTARNGGYSQLLRLAKTKEGWIQATRVERDGKVLFEQIGNGYPLEENGKVDWKGKG